MLGDEGSRTITWAAYKLTDVIGFHGDRMSYEIQGHVAVKAPGVGTKVVLFNGRSAVVMWVDPIRHHLGVEYREATQVGYFL